MAADGRKVSIAFSPGIPTVSYPKLRVLGGGNCKFWSGIPPPRLAAICPAKVCCFCISLILAQSSLRAARGRESCRFRLSWSCFFYDFDFGFGQIVKVIDEAVDLSVGGGDLAIQRGFLLRGLGGG